MASRPSIVAGFLEPVSTAQTSRNDDDEYSTIRAPEAVVSSRLRSPLRSARSASVSIAPSPVPGHVRPPAAGF
jgi:hypothetical protein